MFTHNWKFVKHVFMILAVFLMLIGVTSLVQARQTVFGTSNPTILYVKPGGSSSGACDSWTNACDLQYALTQANPATGTSDEIWVAKGQYMPTTDIDHPETTFTLKDNVALYGGFQGNEMLRSDRDWTNNVTVLSGDIGGNDTTDPNGVVTNTANIIGTNTYNVVTSNGTDSTAILDGFVVTAGYYPGWIIRTGEGGAGLYNKLGSPTIQNTTFSGNYAWGNGGGIWSSNGAPTIVNVTFVADFADHGNGGGLFFATDASFLGQDNPPMIGLTFKGNKADVGAGGGATFYDHSNIQLINISFLGNSATCSGCTSIGGGLYMNRQGSMQITNGRFSGNASLGGWGDGGGIGMGGGGLTMTNVTFSGNYATRYGGALSGGDTSIVNSILWGDSAPTGSEIYNSYSPLIPLTATFSDVQGGYTGSGNINVDPLFVSPVAASSTPTISGDYHLQHTSPAIDAGSNSLVTATTDLDGNPRISGLAVDMGAYEFSEGLQASQSVSADPVVPGSPLTYTLSVTNTGAADLHIIVTDTLPAAVSPAGPLTWTDIILSAQGIWTQTVVVTVMDGYSGTLTNQLTAVAAEGPTAHSTLTSQARLGDQTITFSALADKTFGDPPFTITAMASSGLPAIFTTSSLACTVAGDQVTLGAAGSCAITAHQAGNANYNPAPDVTRTFAIAKANQVITFSTLADKTYGDSPFTVSATASSGLAVTFSTSGSCTVDGSQVTLTGAGSCSITAHQAGNANYNAAPDVTQSFTITPGKTNQTITFSPIPNRTMGDPPFFVSATASSGLQVSISTTSTTCSLSDYIYLLGYMVTLVSDGDCVLTASQPGNADYNPAPDVTQSFTISKADQTITFGPLPSRTMGDLPFFVSATASSGLQVSISTTSTACSLSDYVYLLAYKVTLVSDGDCVLTASQPGNANYNPAPDVTQTFTISKANQTITFGPLLNRTFGDPEFFLMATASSGLPVNFTTNSPACTIGYIPLVGYPVTLVGAGNCAITAHQDGDATYNPAPDVTQTFKIAKANQTINFSALPNKTPSDPPFSLTATASSGLAVTYQVVTKTGYPASPCSISGNIITLTGPGLCDISAYQDGNANFNPAPAIAHSFAITRDIDVAISLYRTPTDWTPYTNIIGYFADAVYEMSNGLQKIHNVTFYLSQNAAVNDHADVYWIAVQWPCAYVGGYHHLDHVYFGDVFPFGPDYNALAPEYQRGAGYTLAHEWGHYYYSLYDEYADNQGDSRDHPHASDVPTPHSIMDMQWYALKEYNPAKVDDYSWLNFSVNKYALNGQGKTAQDRMYYVDGWSTVWFPAMYDPPRHDSYGDLYLERSFYPELVKGYPFGGDASLELTTTPTQTTRSDLHLYYSSGQAPASASVAAPDAVIQGAAAYGASVTSLFGNAVAYPQPVMLVASASKDEHIAEAGITTSVTAPDGTVSSLALKDDGVAPDALAHDGLYTTIMPYTQNGVYTVTTTFDNNAGTAVFTQIAEAHAIGPQGQAWTPTTQLVGENFSVTATTQVTITNFQADDHGDTPQTATPLQPDDVHVPGRIDRPGDVDVFQVTPDVTGTLVLRLSDVALGLSPRIRVLDADGTTVLSTFDVQRQGDMYFFTRLQAQAGVPFYVEVSDQNASATGGLYDISVGPPLNISQEQATVTVFLPLIMR